jgi:glycosyltransferase involved in cell wall biosynthesis
MKIAYLNQPWEISSPPYASGSLAIFSYQVARRFAREPGHEVVVYEKSREATTPAAETVEGVTYVRVGMSLRDRVARGVLRRIGKLRPPQRSHFAHSQFFGDYARRVAIDLRQRACDIVHIHNFSQFVPPIRRHNPNIKIILHMNCDWLAQVDASMLESRLAQCDQIMGCSEHVTGGVRRRFPQFAERCRTVFNGADTDWFTPVQRDDNAPETRLVFVGRVSPEKGVHDLLDAFAIVVKDHPQARLELLGQVIAAPREYMVDISADPKVRALDRFYAKGVDYGAALKAQMTPDVAERTTFTSFLPQQEVAERVKHADVMVLASLTDACPLPVIEAMCCGVPVVGSRVGGIPELVDDGVTGVLAESGNPSELAAAMKKVLADAALRREMGQAGRERALKMFSWDRIVDVLKVCYREALTPADAPAAQSASALPEHAFA